MLEPGVLGFYSPHYYILGLERDVLVLYVLLLAVMHAIRWETLI